jgi:hypothetical protein
MPSGNLPSRQLIIAKFEYDNVLKNNLPQGSFKKQTLAHAKVYFFDFSKHRYKSSAQIRFVLYLKT